MWIRTQDKKRLIDCKELRIKIMVDVQHSPYVIVANNDNSEYFKGIAVYPTKERCLEVLDEIQDAMIGKLIIPINGQEIHHLPIVYQMPEE